MLQRTVDWLDERLDLTDVKHFIAEKGVPVHTQKVWYYLGGLTLFLFGVQVFTGILLLLYYRPSAAEAYESVQFIVTQGAVRLADSQHPQLVGEPADRGRLRALLQRVLPEVVPQAARADVGDGHAAALPHARLRLQRLPPAVERAVVLRDEGRHGHRRRGAGRRPLRAPPPARRRRCDRRDAVAVLRPARRHSAGDHDGARRGAPALRPAPGDERAAEHRAEDEAGRDAAADAVLPELHPARRALLVRRDRAAGGARAVLSRGSSAPRPIRSRRCRPASGPSGISSRCSTR